MQEISRPTYLNKLIRSRNNGFIKAITGIRRSGKSYLLNPIFKNYLQSSGIPEDHIILVNLENDQFSELLKPDHLSAYVRSKIKDEAPYFALLDEIQLVPQFESVLNGFLHIPNLDTYVTGSNSRFLSSDIITEFRGRSQEIRLYPLNFAEFMSAYQGNIADGWDEYYHYGGLPQILTQTTESDKINFLNSQMSNVYINDIIERYRIKNKTELDTLIEIIASSTGSLTNPYKLERTFKSLSGIDLHHDTIGDYLEKLEHAFMIERVRRFDVKGKKYINTPSKYYFTDVGIRNSCVDFRQVEENHLMENIIYLTLKQRGYRVDVGVVEVRDNNKARKQYEVDFVASLGDRLYYIQSALTIGDSEKRAQESRSLSNIDDHFTKIIISRDVHIAGHENNGIATLGLFDFLLNEDILDSYK